MINEQKERNTLTKMSDLEYSKNDVEMMRYRANKLAYSLGLGGMAASIFACFIGLNSMAGGTVNTIVVIMINIVVLLGGFLACEKTKSYGKTGCISLIVFGGLSVARIFYVPLIIMSNFSVYNTLVEGYNKNTLNDVEKTAITNAKTYLGATITSYYENSEYANAFLSPNGIVRGVFAIVLLVISAALFITGGVIGYMRSVKLNTYLNSLKDVK